MHGTAHAYHAAEAPAAHATTGTAGYGAQQRAATELTARLRGGTLKVPGTWLGTMGGSVRSIGNACVAGPTATSRQETRAVLGGRATKAMS